MKYDGFSFDNPSKSEEGADTDIFFASLSFETFGHASSNQCMMALHKGTFRNTFCLTGQQVC